MIRKDVPVGSKFQYTNFHNGQWRIAGGDVEDFNVLPARMNYAGFPRLDAEVTLSPDQLPLTHEALDRAGVATGLATPQDRVDALAKERDALKKERDELTAQRDKLLDGRLGLFQVPAGCDLKPGEVIHAVNLAYIEDVRAAKQALFDALGHSTGTAGPILPMVKNALADRAVFAKQSNAEALQELYMVGARRYAIDGRELSVSERIQWLAAEKKTADERVRVAEANAKKFEQALRSINQALSLVQDTD